MHHDLLFGGSRGSRTDAWAALAAIQEARQALERRFRWFCPLEAALGRPNRYPPLARTAINYNP
jgi:hypothetical protein